MRAHGRGTWFLAVARAMMRPLQLAARQIPGSRSVRNSVSIAERSPASPAAARFLLHMLADSRVRPNRSESPQYC